ncbi:hypothetical protein OIU79_022175 [Salix purpurea]|uniref:Uncharacterized protein n=1 Tax=Salix purpurea TaxID=77065 RepID=A0A9Q1ACL8_SALPP|nr:hypothetical protein OIU79_022175 [Salix purpurea]
MVTLEVAIHACDLFGVCLCPLKNQPLLSTRVSTGTQILEMRFLRTIAGKPAVFMVKEAIAVSSASKDFGFEQPSGMLLRSQIAMSGLVDIWSSELAKLRERGQTMGSSGSSPTNVEGGLRLVKSLPAIFRGMRFNSPALTCSEASLSMLIDCFIA